MPDEYDRIRKGLSRAERGLYFEIGRAHMLGETPSHGWVKQFTINTKRGPRILDSAHSEGCGIEGRERKSVRVGDISQQVKLERSALEAGQMTRSRWETVAGEDLSRSAADDLAAMKRDFGDRFHHDVISREDAAHAIRIGRSLVSTQLELVQPYVLLRAQRARERLGKIREIIRSRERAAQEKEGIDHALQIGGVPRTRMPGYRLC